MTVFTVHVTLNDGGGFRSFDQIKVAADRKSVGKALMDFELDPMSRMFLNPTRNPGFSEFWKWVCDRIDAYEGSESALVTRDFGGGHYLIAVEPAEVISAEGGGDAV